MTKLRLRDIAHARSGDKDNDSNVSIWVYQSKDYDLALKALSPLRLKDAFPNILLGQIDVYPMPQLDGFNLVLRDALEGGVNSSLNLDGHGKTWSSMILSLPLEVPHDP